MGYGTGNSPSPPRPSPTSPTSPTFPTSPASHLPHLPHFLTPSVREPVQERLLRSPGKVQ